MVSEPGWSLTASIDRVTGWSRDVKVAGVFVTIFLGIHGVVHVLLATDDHVQVSLHDVGLVLWGVTTLLALGGLVAFGRAYISLVSHLDTEPRVDLEILPEDERRILVSIISTPGITQMEVVARSGFSDAKVSQTLKAMRERGLVYREPQGRTYRLYPGAVLTEIPNGD